MVAARPALFARRSALLQLVQSSKQHGSLNARSVHLFSSDVSPAAPSSADGKKQPPKEERMTNKKLWDRVLTNHPEHHDKLNGDLLYEHSRKKYFGMASAGSLAHIAFWSWFKGYEQSLIEMMPQVTEPTIFSFVTNDLGSSIGFGSSIMLAFLLGFHARRSVGRIAVVSGGDKLRITTHKFFGDYSEPFDVPVANVSANPNMKKNMILKVGKDRGFYLVDIDGNFYNRDKLESMITFRTDFTEHEKMIDLKEKKSTSMEVRTGLPRTELKPSSGNNSSDNNKVASLPKRIAVSKANAKGNLLGRKPSNPRKNKNKK